MNILRFGFFGLFMGAFFGAVIGSGQLFKRQVIKQEMKADFASWQWTIYGAIGGALIMGSIGAKTDRKEKTRIKEEKADKERAYMIREALGLMPYPPVEISKEGLYWVAISRWTDPRKGKEYVLKTYCDEAGRLVTTLGAFTIIHSTTTAANEEEVTAAHGTARVKVFKTLIDAYEKNNQVTVEEAVAQT